MDVFEQHGKICDSAAAFDGTSVGIDVLSQEGDLLDPLIGQISNFYQYILKRTRHFRTTGIGYNTKTAVFAAPLHDGDKGSRAVHTGRGQIVKLFDFWKADIDLGTSGTALLLNHIGQPMQCLWPKNQVNKGRPLYDGLPLLTSDTAADTDDEIGILLLEMPHPTQIGENLFLFFFDFWKADIDLGTSGTALLLNHIGQPMQCLWPKNQVNKGRPLYDGLPLLTSDTAADTDDEIGILLLEMPHPTQIGENLFLCFFAH